MYSTYHFKSAADINIDIIDAIKTAYKEKPVILTIEEDDEEFNIPEAQKHFVQNSIKQYAAKPELLITEDDAWKMINAD